MVYRCGTCRQRFPAGWSARERHFKDYRHRPPPFECDTCTRCFGDDRAVRDHMDALGHWAESASEIEYEVKEEPVLEEYLRYFPSEEGCDEVCEECNLSFIREKDWELHNQVFHHYCGSCNRTFKDYNGLTQHLNSTAHRSVLDLQCPFCRQYKTTATSLVYHIEGGRCPEAPLNRYSLFKTIQDRDPNRIITKKPTQRQVSTDVHYTASERAYNPRARAYECYLCHRYFNYLNGLNDHLNSPFHEEKFYRCPSRRCNKRFTTLAGMISHLESETCQYMRFDAVQQHVIGIVDPQRLITF
ncbi:hypothetical protein CPLU01_06182 [Colletotrichum plurivorum]|uniref:C2H2-type domain-containing protein n=1 Tax=Colletotrichum plurivorum TaxID=2175906 RepID=A0A8H6KIZ8_9PEZI|nr:hypothetical protein CPLU01_06182 [Colletotrichum plurivorum]